jgi:ubiquinone/menaquinone biosynthesis C-methylase UbiE
LPLKRRFPDARVVGIDIAAPMLQMAHRKAESRGLPIEFSQRLAEHTGYPDESFDLAFAQILFHEVPTDAAEQVMREARRILRPGGLFCIADVEPYSELDPFDRYITDWQTDNNEEPFWRAWGTSDGCAMLKAAGFSDAWLTSIDNPMAPGRKQYLTIGRK